LRPPRQSSTSPLDCPIQPSSAFLAHGSGYKEARSGQRINENFHHGKLFVTVPNRTSWSTGEVATPVNTFFLFNVPVWSTPNPGTVNFFGALNPDYDAKK
jgi:hypothetical protein